MNKEKAIRFLKLHQPLPPDIHWTDELATEYNQVRKFFVNHPDPAIIPFFLNSFGDGNGLGLYQMVEHIFAAYTTSEMLPFLIQSLHSEYESVQYWTARICGQFPDERLIKPLVFVVNNSAPETKYWCFVALENILEATGYDYAALILPIVEERIIIEKEQQLVSFLINLRKKIAMRLHLK